jgi:hypothetical protein
MRRKLCGKLMVAAMARRGRQGHSCGQIDSYHITYSDTAKQGHPCVTFVLQSNLFFEIEPPLARGWRNTARNSGADMNPGHVELFRQLPRNVMTSGAGRPFVGLLQC